MHHDVGDVVHAESQPLSVEADDAWAAGPNHLNLGPMVQPDLTQAVDHQSVAEDLADLPLLSGPEI
jgi:hypothetical protein